MGKVDDDDFGRTMSGRLYSELRAMIKLRTTLGKFGEFWDHIAIFLLARLGRNHFINTKFSKLSKEIADPSDDHELTHSTMYRIFCLKGWRGGGSNKLINKGGSHIMFHSWSPVATMRPAYPSVYLNSNTSYRILTGALGLIFPFGP